MSDAPGSLWDRLQACPGWRAGNVLDIRPACDFETGHLPGSVNLPLHLPAEPPWPDRRAGPDFDTLVEARIPSIFLPPGHEPLLVVAGEPAGAAACAAALRGRGRVEVQGLALPRDWSRVLPAGMTVAGPSRGHLWRPPAWLVRHEEWLPPPAAGPVLDLACGSGRAAVWLAARGYRVTGLDRQPDALALAALLAASCGVTCRFAPVDLRRLENLPAGPWSVVMAFRFLQRELLPGFADLLSPGGVVLIRTFRRAPGSQGPPHRRHRLEAGELPGFFPPPRFEVLAHEESLDPDGRPAAGIVARRT